MTTASSATAVPFRQNRFLQLLCAVLGVIFIASGARPEERFAWWLESALALVFLVILACTYRKLALSDTSYLLILIFLGLHEWGAYEMYSYVPLGEWMKPWFGTERNHYDRLVHFSYGFLLAYPMQEWFMRSAGVHSRFRYFLPIQFTLACSAVYEILEAWAASILSPEHGQEFLGMQGDIWDAQKDMLMAAIGASITMGLLAYVRSRQPATAQIRQPASWPLQPAEASLKPALKTEKSGLRA
ncbi:MAG: DUF2238 domain-containing protein [Acidobacteriota bacterium]